MTIAHLGQYWSRLALRLWHRRLVVEIAVGADGAVSVAWLDTCNDANRVSYDVYMARAADGVHFGSNFRVSNVSSNPNNDPQLQGSLIGDYFALAAGSNTVYSVWTDTRNGNEDIYLAPVTASSTNESTLGRPVGPRTGRAARSIP